MTLFEGSDSQLKVLYSNVDVISISGIQTHGHLIWDNQINHTTGKEVIPFCVFFSFSRRQTHRRESRDDRSRHLQLVRIFRQVNADDRIVLENGRQLCQRR